VDVEMRKVQIGNFTAAEEKASGESKSVGETIHLIDIRAESCTFNQASVDRLAKKRPVSSVYESFIDGERSRLVGWTANRANSAKMSKMFSG
jgi:hypothetical protein